MLQLIDIKTGLTVGAHRSMLSSDSMAAFATLPSSQSINSLTPMYRDSIKIFTCEN